MRAIFKGHKWKKRGSAIKREANAYRALFECGWCGREVDCLSSAAYKDRFGDGGVLLSHLEHVEECGVR